MTPEKKQKEKKNLAHNLEKIVVNIGVGKLSSQPNFSEKVLPSIIEDVSLITGQKPSTRSAKKSIAGFKIREGLTVGIVSTLRDKRMSDFFEKLVNIVLPRIRDFRGIKKESIDKNGSLSIGIRENIVFPEISPEISKTSFGVQITVVPKTIRSREKALEMYSEIGIPFKKD